MKPPSTLFAAHHRKWSSERFATVSNFFLYVKYAPSVIISWCTLCYISHYGARFNSLEFVVSQRAIIASSFIRLWIGSHSLAPPALFMEIQSSWVLPSKLFKVPDMVDPSRITKADSVECIVSNASEDKQLSYGTPSWGRSRRSFCCIHPKDLNLLPTAFWSNRSWSVKT